MAIFHKTVEKMKIQLVRLVSGEEVVGDVVENDDHVLIKDGYSLVAPEPGKGCVLPPAIVTVLSLAFAV